MHLLTGLAKRFFTKGFVAVPKIAVKKCESSCTNLLRRRRNCAHSKVKLDLENESVGNEFLSKKVWYDLVEELTSLPKTVRES